MKKTELQKQTELKEIARRLRAIKRERKRDRNNPYPRCDYDYGSLIEEYDPLTGKKKLSWALENIDIFSKQLN